MEGYLQSKDRAKERLKLGPNGNSVTPVTEAELSHLRLIGSFSFIAGKRVCLYRWDGRLWLRLGDEHPIDLDGVQVDWMTSNGNVAVVLRRGSETILKESYPLSPDIEYLPNDPTPFAEAEDFDFFLFVRNVLSDPARTKRIYPVL